MAESVRAVLDTGTGSNRYVNDIGTALDWSFRVYVPEDMTRTQVEDVLTAMGCRIADDPIPCPLRSYLMPRYVQFVRRSGHTMKVPVWDRTNLVSITQAGRDSLNGAVADNPVVCIRLNGEHYPNLYDDVVTSTGSPTAIDDIQPPADSGKTRLMYSTVMQEYKADSTAAFGGNILMPVRMITDTEDSPPSNFDPITDCIGTVDDTFCPSRQVRESRRFIPTFITNNANLPTQSLTVPVAGHEATEIKDCGQNLADLDHVVCLEYQGENNSRFDLVI